MAIRELYSICTMTFLMLDLLALIFVIRYQKILIEKKHLMFIDMKKIYFLRR